MIPTRSGLPTFGLVLFLLTAHATEDGPVFWDRTQSEIDKDIQIAKRHGSEATDDPRQLLAWKAKPMSDSTVLLLPLPSAVPANCPRGSQRPGRMCPRFRPLIRR